MRITPLDVRKQEFRKAMRGLDAEEVYAFLSTVADEYEAVLNDNKALRERLLELDDKVQEYRSLEKTLRNTLLTAERVTVESKDNARREATIIVKEAQIEADKSLRDIRTEAMTLRQQVQQLRSQREAYLARMKVVAESHLDFIDSAHSDFEVDDASIQKLDVRTTRETETKAPAQKPNLFEGSNSGPLVSDQPQSPAPEMPAPRPAEPIPAPEAAPAAAPPQTDFHTPPQSVPPAPQGANVSRGDVPAPGAPHPQAPYPAPARPEGPRPEPTASSNDSVIGANATNQESSGGSMADISAIIDRMQQGQREIIAPGSTDTGAEKPGRGAVPTPRLGADPEGFAPLADPIAGGESPPVPARNPMEASIREGLSRQLDGSVGIAHGRATGDQEAAAPQTATQTATAERSGYQQTPANDVTSEWKIDPNRRTTTGNEDDSDR
jgi:cell division initiation protein